MESSAGCRSAIQQLKSVGRRSTRLVAVVGAAGAGCCVASAAMRLVAAAIASRVDVWPAAGRALAARAVLSGL